MILLEVCGVRILTTSGVGWDCQILLVFALIVVGSDVVSEVECELLRDACAVVVVLEDSCSSVFIALFLILRSLGLTCAI